MYGKNALESQQTSMRHNTHNKTPEELFKAIRGIALSERAQTRMRKNLDKILESYADAPLVRIGETTRLAESGVPISIIRSPLLLFTKRYITMPIPLIIALLLAGGTSYAAESALPGNALYPVKVEVNERIAGLLNVSDEAKAQWQARLAERRIAETKDLANENALDPETKDALARKIVTHVDNAIEYTHALDAGGKRDVADRVRANVDTSLRAYDDVLRTQTDDTNSESGDASGVYTNIYDRYRSELQFRADTANPDATFPGPAQSESDAARYQGSQGTSDDRNTWYSNDDASNTEQRKDWIYSESNKDDAAEAQGTSR